MARATSFNPFFRVAGSGYAADERGTSEHAQVSRGWQSEWSLERDEPLEAHALSKNPCVVYGLPRNVRNAADIVALCERAIAGARATRVFVPRGEDFAFVTFRAEEDARALCASGLECEDERGTRARCEVDAARTPGPAVCRWRARLRDDDACARS